MGRSSSTVAMIRRSAIPALLAVFFLPRPGAAQGAPKEVLVLHSYQNDYEWTRLINQGINEELEEARDLSCQVKSEFLDAKRAWDEGRAEAFAGHLSRRYSGFPPDLVLVSDNDAYEFMLLHGERIFGSVPWVFTGVNDFSETSIARVRNRVTGVVERIDYESTLRLILELFPETREVKVLLDQTTTGPKTLHELLMTAESTRFPLPVTSFPDVPFREVLRTAVGLPETTAVFLLAYARDGAGELWSTRDVASRVSAAASGPVFAIWDFFLGHGIVGGALTSGLDQGREAGRMALRILRGESPGDIPVRDVPSPPVILDWRQLKRFRVPASRLPPEARIEFRPPALHERDPTAFWIMVGLAAAALVMAGSLAVIGAAYRKVRQSEDRLAASLREKETLLREVHHRVKNNFQVTASLLSLQAGSVEDERARAALRDSENRIRSMALVHAEVYEERDLSNINFGEYARSLAGYLISSHAEIAGASRFLVSGESLSMGMDRAVPLGLVLNELITNSLKYAVRGREGCSMELRIAGSPGGGWILRYSDDGPGLPPGVTLESPGTLGLQLVTLLVQQAGGRVERDPEIPAGYVIRLGPGADGGSPP